MTRIREAARRAAARRLSALRLLTDAAERLCRRDDFRIEHAVQNGGLATGDGTFEGRRKIFGAFHPLTVATECLGVRGKVGVVQGGGRNAARVMAFLVHADGAV